MLWTALLSVAAILGGIAIIRRHRRRVSDNATPIEKEVYNSIKRRGPATIRELAKRLKEDEARVAWAVDRLEARSSKDCLYAPDE